MKLETVKVKHDSEDGYMIINKSDLTDKHVLYDSGGRKQRKAAKESAKETEQPS